VIILVCNSGDGLNNILYCVRTRSESIEVYPKVTTIESKASTKKVFHYANEIVAQAMR